MNTILTTPDVKLFVVAVRQHLADLSEDEREELVGGLEADMNDLVAERGLDALPEPRAYAAELRTAAGLGELQRSSQPGAHLRESMMAWLDRGATTWRRWVVSRDHLGIPALLDSLRPVWWVLRALCAAALAVEVWGSQGVTGLTPNRSLLIAALVLVSVQIGRGAWWPGTRLGRSLDLRLAILVLNGLAIVLLPVMFSRFMGAVDPAMYVGEPVYPDTLSVGERPVRNIYAYDAQGNPLIGVQLVDQDGRRLNVTRYDDDGTAPRRVEPWRNGASKLFNVFPMPVQTFDPETHERVGEPALQTPPFASLPPVMLEGVEASRLLTGKPSSAKTTKPQAEKQDQGRSPKRG